ncbi:response regulator [Tessaracoccus terricola]
MGNTKRAVIVEDDDDIRGLLEIVLGQMGYEAIAAVTGEQGITSVREHAPELVTLDIGLPGVNGLDVLTQLREFHSGPVVVVSARGRAADAERALAAGADGYLVKPFRPRTLREDLERILGR